jgi:hypothetical protein
VRYGGDAIGTYGGFPAGINQAAVAITGGTITGITDLAVADGGTGASTAQAAAAALAVPYIFSKTGIPFIGLSSGSVSAAGAISGITALPRTITKAYCYFPANILATVKAAGWYYCTFSSTTAGTAFLDAYTSGVPTIPSSPAAVIDGKGAFTGDTGEEFGPTFNVSANALGLNGFLRAFVTTSATNNANVKSIRVRYSGNAGAIMGLFTASSAPGTEGVCIISNHEGSAALQVGSSFGVVGASAAPSGTPTTVGAADTTVATTAVVSIQRATATDNLILEFVLFELLSDLT